MSLYGESRDISFINNINRELLNRIVETKIGYYKISLDTTVSNIYGESSAKKYGDPALLNCLIIRNEQSTSDSDFGPDRLRNVSFAFFKADLELIQLVPEIGDVCLWGENYYEVDNTVENQLFVGKDPDYPYDTDYLNRFGSSISLIVNTHLTREDKLNIKRSR